MECEELEPGDESVVRAERRTLAAVEDAAILEMAQPAQRYRSTNPVLDDPLALAGLSGADTAVRIDPPPRDLAIGLTRRSPSSGNDVHRPGEVRASPAWLGYTMESRYSSHLDKKMLYFSLSSFFGSKGSPGSCFSSLATILHQ